jgi:hypothetical protein
VWKSRSENILVNQVFDYFSSRALIIFPRTRFDYFSSRAALIKIPSPRFDYFSSQSRAFDYSYQKKRASLPGIEPGSPRFRGGRAA